MWVWKSLCWKVPAAEGRWHSLLSCCQQPDLSPWWQRRGYYYGLKPMMTDYEYLTEISSLAIFWLSILSCLVLSICPCSRVSPSPVPCMSNFTAPSGTVLSPDYPEGYGNNMNCVWLIQSEPGSRIHLAFNDFDLEAPYDSLTVKDGETNDALVIGRFTGAESPSYLTSNTNTLRLEFQADHSMSGRGFNITYSSRSFFFFWLFQTVPSSYLGKLPNLYPHWGNNIPQITNIIVSFIHCNSISGHIYFLLLQKIVSGIVVTWGYKTAAPSV